MLVHERHETYQPALLVLKLVSQATAHGQILPKGGLEGALRANDDETSTPREFSLEGRAIAFQT